MRACAIKQCLNVIVRLLAIRPTGGGQAVREVEVDSFVSFIKETDIFDLIVDLVIFRGQPVRRNLLPSVSRKNPSVDTTGEEKKILKQLKLQGASMLPGIGETDLDLLVLAQHYGLKTRLLDWTSNPLAALWFACSEPKEGDVYVYALEADNLLEEDVYGKDPFSSALTRVFQPRLNNSRIVAQQGWFTLHRYANKNSMFVALEHNPKIAAHLHEFRIPAGKRAEILTALDRHGVTAKTVFPDLSGLCQHLNWKYGLG